MSGALVTMNSRPADKSAHTHHSSTPLSVQTRSSQYDRQSRVDSSCLNISLFMTPFCFISPYELPSKLQSSCPESFCQNDFSTPQQLLTQTSSSSPSKSLSIRPLLPATKTARAPIMQLQNTGCILFQFLPFNKEQGDPRVKGRQQKMTGNSRSSG